MSAKVSARSVMDWAKLKVSSSGLSKLGSFPLMEILGMRGCTARRWMSARRPGGAEHRDAFRKYLRLFSYIYWRLAGIQIISGFQAAQRSCLSKMLKNRPKIRERPKNLKSEGSLPGFKYWNVKTTELMRVFRLHRGPSHRHLDHTELGGEMSRRRQHLGTSSHDGGLF